ncbi:MAG: multifunctional CCA tRNA nucleotidyl transferase/2'3'-cyclic phosphodiesterase/2'nucleotidase/phosphatase [Steroidobacteraceae bacterium]
MQVYLVGGAVRDQLLGLKASERDWVVVGATPAELEAQGFRPVGREFPVFLHPQTQEEYALARLERKSGPGYRGFVTDFSPQVTLAEDLKRRDLTVNAMARSERDELIDPYGGQADLAARRLRHVSEAFVEDPVRILRAARFLARFAPLGFAIAPETLQLMRTMVNNGEADALVPERVWRELARALQEARPDLFFTTLADCGALAVVMPEIARHLGAEAGALTLPALRLATQAGAATSTRFAVLLAQLPPEEINAVCLRLRAPAEYRELAELSARLGALLHEGDAPPPVKLAKPQWLLQLLESADAWRRPERFAQWLEVLSARAQAGGVPPPAALGMGQHLRAALATTAAVKPAPAEQQNLKGPQIAARIRELRLAALQALPPPPGPPPSGPPPH